MNIKKDNKKRIRTSMMFSIVFICIFAVGLIKIAGERNRKAIPFEELIADYNGNPDEAYTEVKVPYAISWYAKTDYTSGKSKQHCLIMLENGDILSLTVNKKDDIDKLSNLINETLSYMSKESDNPPSALSFAGEIKKIESDVYDYFRQGIEYFGVSDAGNNYRVYELTIDATEGGVIIYVIICLAFLLAVIFAISALLIFNSSKKNINEHTTVEPEDTEYDSCSEAYASFARDAGIGRNDDMRHEK